MNIGQKVKQLRLERGWSQEYLASLLGYKSRSSINKIELGLTDLNQSRIYAIANIFHVDPAVFFEAMNETPTEQNYQNWDCNIENQRIELVKNIEILYGKQAVKMLELLSSMNDLGQKKAVEQVELLTSVPQFQKG